MTQVLQSELISGAIVGQVVSFPTDTVPALAAKPEQSAAIFAVKQRPPTKPLILMGSAFADLLPYIAGTAAEIEQWEDVTRKYWPGALTLVLPASPLVPVAMNPLNSSTIGVRVPDREIARSILSQTGPLATTSANRSGEPPLETLAEIEAAFPKVLTLASPDFAPTQIWGSGQPSTVAQWTGKDWAILRQGSIKGIS